MASLVGLVAALALLAPPPALAYPPGLGCLTSDCESDWTIWDTPSTFCQNNTAIDVINSCISFSTCSDSEKNNAYQGVAQVCVNAGITVTAKPEATIAVTSGGNAWPFAWTSSGGRAWGHGGPFGPGHNGGWGPWGSDGQWTSGAWTSWWNNLGRGPGYCPNQTWPGWTSGEWRTAAPWTTWTSCTCYTTDSTTITISSGTAEPTTSVSYIYRVAEAAAASVTSTASTQITATETRNAAPTKHAGPGAVAAVAVAALFL